MNLTQVSIEQANPLQRRIIERIRRMLDGQDINFAGTVAVNIMIDVIFTRITDGDVEAMDIVIDDLAAGLKAACRTCVALDKGALQ